MDSIISQVKALAASADDVDRKNIIVALRDLSHSLESSDDTMQRIMFYVSLKMHFCFLVSILFLYSSLDDGLIIQTGSIFKLHLCVLVLILNCLTFFLPARYHLQWTVYPKKLGLNLLCLVSVSDFFFFSFAYC